MIEGPCLVSWGWALALEGWVVRQQNYHQCQECEEQGQRRGGGEEEKRKKKMGKEWEAGCGML